MKNTILIIMFLSMAACTTRTEYGSCIGAFADKNPNLEYHVKLSNAFWAAVFSETLVVPIIVIADRTFCPTDKK